MSNSFSKNIVIGSLAIKVFANDTSMTQIPGIFKKGISRECRSNNICILATDKKSSLINNLQQKVKVNLESGDVLFRIDRKTFAINGSIYVKDRNKFYQFEAVITPQVQEAIINVLLNNNIDVPDHLFDLEAA